MAGARCAAAKGGLAIAGLLLLLSLVVGPASASELPAPAGKLLGRTAQIYAWSDLKYFLPVRDFGGEGPQGSFICLCVCPSGVGGSSLGGGE